MATRVGYTEGVVFASTASVTTAGTVAVQAGDGVLIFFKYEGGTSGAPTFADSGGVVTSYAVAVTEVKHTTTNDSWAGMHYGIATGAGTVSWTMTYGAGNRSFGLLGAFVARPAASRTFAIGTGAAAGVSAQGTSSSPSAGSLTAGDAGAALMGSNEYSDGGAYTPNTGGGWAEESEQDGEHQYLLVSGAGSITGSCTCTNPVDWVAVMAFLQESSAAPISDAPEKLRVVRSGIRLR